VSLQTNGSTLHIKSLGINMATASDGYGDLTFRDTTNVVGGQHGNVNTAKTVKTVAGKNERAFEWAMLAWLDNYSDFGENVASYSQANKYGKGPTWAGCDEVCCTDPLDTTATVGREVDVWVSGTDSGNRVGLDVTVGDARTLRKLPGAGVAEATYGVRVTASGATPWARWIVGWFLTSFKECGLMLESIATRAIWLKGKYIVGLDFSTAECQSAIRLAPGQRMTFEPTDQISWSWLDDRLRVQNGSANVLEIDTTTGDIFKRGVKVL